MCNLKSGFRRINILRHRAAERGSFDPMVDQPLKSLVSEQLPGVLLSEHFTFSDSLYHPLQIVSMLCCFLWTQIGRASFRAESVESL